MAHRLKPLTRLQDAQLLASSPSDHAALSASAGTGKTHVLTARVLRLLLGGVDPSSILCLTFTKAGAAEMAGRILERLAYWVRLDDVKLRKELFALGEPNDPDSLGRARTLFARVLDAPGGGLRIQTIHAFAQSLLASFPAEAGLIPGFRPLEGREEQQLARQTLAEMLVQAEAGGDLGVVRDIQRLSLRLGEGGAESFLMACARAPEAMASLGPREGVEARLRHAFDLPLGPIEDTIEAECCDTVFDMATLREVAAMNGAWATKNGLERASVCERWMSAEKPERAKLLDALHLVWAKADGEPRSYGKGQAPADPSYAEQASALFECCSRLVKMRKRAAYTAELAAGLRAGQTFAVAYMDAKRAAAAVDFDDLIRWTERLLREPGMGDWVRYKLDQQTDHILVDEAQDTNRSQWSIVEALAEEYFSGAGASGRHRTLFTVGDFKQAIFSFQGTDPREFDRAREHFQSAAKHLRHAALDGGEPDLPPDFLDLSMDRSFRSSPQVLAAVDQVIAELSPASLGLPKPPNIHQSHHATRDGSVLLWAPFTDDREGDGDEGEEGWTSDTLRRYAASLARQIRLWLDQPFRVASKGRPLRPEDILILVKRRGDLASLLVARLYAEQVPVAGIDRLLLSAPLAVQDLLAAARFAVQPLDDLNLACLLVSPLFGWSQDDLYAGAYGRKGSLWAHLRSLEGGPGRLPSTLAGLRMILDMADYTTPYEFFETILSGPLDGRRKLMGRLGAEAADPIDELLASALDYESGVTPALQAFLDWFSRGDVEVVRDPSSPLDAVRVMTVHGSKGLQAPVVILADACANPDRKGGNANLVEAVLEPGGPEIPLFRPRKDEAPEELGAQLEAQDRLDREEHWRLLYVAMTRAEERLYVGGALGPADRGVPAEASWYAAIQRGLTALEAEAVEMPIWTKALRYGPAEQPRTKPVIAPERAAALPDWLRRPAPAEQRPPVPLTPSSIGEDDVAHPPPGPEQRRAAERGKLLHQLFERLTALAPDTRAHLADRWLERSAGVADAVFRQELVHDACHIISDPAFAALFGPDALAEAPIAAVVENGLVVSGTVDRLLVEPGRILVADFKTGRLVPGAPEEAPAAHLRQMAAYRAALRVIFPDRDIETALLYTAGPVLHALPDTLLDRHQPVPG